MKVFVVICCLIVTSYSANFGTIITARIDLEWNEWKAKYGKSYKDEKEENIRRNIWEKHRTHVDQHNAEAEAGMRSFTLGMNQFSDMETYNFLDNYFSPLPNIYDSHADCDSTVNISSFNNDGTLPEEVDWRTKGYVTPVKDQDLPWTCGSCWAFAAIGSLEGQLFKKTGKLISLSEQNLLDCSSSGGDDGCNGGFADYAFQYIVDNGIEANNTYPYKAKGRETNEYDYWSWGDREYCRFNRTNVVANITSCIDVMPRGDELSLQIAVAHVGPITVGIDAHPISFHSYKEGIYDEPFCSSTLEEINHAVVVVGYGTENGTDYWIVKNSWGTDWGMDGYVKMIRNRNNRCAIATYASFPVM